MSADGNDTLDQWRGGFGASYIERNQPSSDTTAEAATAFGRMLHQADGHVGSVLEIGANVGINLRGLRRLLGASAKLSALEPIAEACAALRGAGDIGLTEVLESTAYEIPKPDGSFDLTFTNGVLIHVPPDKLARAMQEITRVSSRYVLCSEYFSHTPLEIPYRGASGLLWKRDFGRMYLETCPELSVLTYGFIWQEELPHFDNLNWWLFEKRA